MKLKQELSQRFELDQKLSKEKKLGDLKNVYHQNTIWLNGIINKIGWPSQDIVSEESAWLIAQHSEDLNFQKKCLQLIKKLPLTNERKGYFAYLTDRILVKENEKQIYGTQFNPINNKQHMIVDIGNLDKRRKFFGLEPFEKYKLRMQNYQNETQKNNLK